MALFNAIRACNTALVKTILETDENLDVNAFIYEDLSALNYVIFFGRKSHREILKLLLLHPKIDLNRHGNLGFTAIYLACAYHVYWAVEILANDPRLDLNAGGWSFEGYILDRIVKWDSYQVLQYLIRNGRLDKITRSVSVRHQNPTDDLLHRYYANPVLEYMKEVRRYRGQEVTDPADLLVLVSILRDGYLVGQRLWETDRRFFKMVGRLPLELQMLVCGHVYGVKDASVSEQDIKCSIWWLDQMRMENKP